MKYLGIIVILFLLQSCNDVETICSNDQNKCLTIMLSHEFNTQPSDVLIFYGKPPIDKKKFARVKWSNMSGLDVYWDSEPLKIRTSPTIYHNTLPKNFVDLGNYIEGKEETGKFTSYDFVELIKGKYSIVN